MKIEIGESLAFSYLRHVKSCWLVQTNWKASVNWLKHMSNDEVNEFFAELKEKFDEEGGVFKKTKNVAQFLKQAEIDVVGVDPNGNIHAVEVSYHSAGLNYRDGVRERVLKKLLRALLMLRAYVPRGPSIHIYFMSPKVSNGDMSSLEEVLEQLESEFPDVNWYLMCNDKFNETVVDATLQKVSDYSDTSELFIRAAQLLKLESSRPSPVLQGETEQAVAKNVEPLQPLIKCTMRFLLEDRPDLLPDKELRKLLSKEGCQRELGLKISLPILVESKEHLEEHLRRRYWKEPFGRFYGCSQWSQQDHLHNAKSFLEWLKILPDLDDALNSKKRKFQEYIQRAEDGALE